MWFDKLSGNTEVFNSRNLSKYTVYSLPPKIYVKNTINQIIHYIFQALNFNKLSLIDSKAKCSSCLNLNCNKLLFVYKSYSANFYPSCINSIHYFALINKCFIHILTYYNIYEIQNTMTNLRNINIIYYGFQNTKYLKRCLCFDVRSVCIYVHHVYSGFVLLLRAPASYRLWVPCVN